LIAPGPVLCHCIPAPHFVSDELANATSNAFF